LRVTLYKFTKNLNYRTIIFKALNTIIFSAEQSSKLSQIKDKKDFLAMLEEDTLSNEEVWSKRQ